MAINKVVYGTNVLIDLTADTVTADKLAQGITAHDKSARGDHGHEHVRRRHAGRDGGGGGGACGEDVLCAREQTDGHDAG